MSMPSPRTLMLAAAIAISLAACQSGETPDPATTPQAPEAPATSVDEASMPGTATTEGVDIMGSGMDAMVKLGGSMQAAAEVCEQSSKAELDAARRQQKEMFVQRGGSEAAFDAVFSQAYQDARAKYAAISDSERETSCRELRELSETPPTLP